MMWYNRYAKQDVRLEYIKDAMKNDQNIRGIKLTKRFIVWLFRHYHVMEHTVHFFDHESYDPEDNEYHNNLVSWEDRISFSSWIDVFGPGIWDASQCEADRFAMEYLNDFRKAGHLEGRCWMGVIPKQRATVPSEKGPAPNEQDMLHIYLYGRDIHECDMHLVLVPKSKLRLP